MTYFIFILLIGTFSDSMMRKGKYTIFKLLSSMILEAELIYFLCRHDRDQMMVRSWSISQTMNWKQNSPFMHSFPTAEHWNDMLHHFPEWPANRLELKWRKILWEGMIQPSAVNFDFYNLTCHSVGEIDVARDIVNAVCTRWVCETLVSPLSAQTRLCIINLLILFNILARLPSQRQWCLRDTEEWSSWAFQLPRDACYQEQSTMAQFSNRTVYAYVGQRFCPSCRLKGNWSDLNCRCTCCFCSALCVRKLCVFAIS